MNGLNSNKTTTLSLNTLSSGCWWITFTIDPLQLHPMWNVVDSCWHEYLKPLGCDYWWTTSTISPPQLHLIMGHNGFLVAWRLQTTMLWLLVDHFHHNPRIYVHILFLLAMVSCMVILPIISKLPKPENYNIGINYNIKCNCQFIFIIRCLNTH